MPVRSVAHCVGRAVGISLIFLPGIVHHADHYRIVWHVGYSQFEFGWLVVADWHIEDKLCPLVTSDVLHIESIHPEATAVSLRRGTHFLSS